jgi:exopolysaccharide production protein ExoQ
MLLAGSRYVSQWLNLSGPITLLEASTDGSPVDAAVFFFLIMLGIFILCKRKIVWGEVIKLNKWICLYFLFCGISILWSDYPFVGFKRWIKELGNLIMVMVILTENYPKEAIKVILRRFTFLMLPASILMIKYYPEFGRAYHMGMLMVTGVASQKNGLGTICLISGIYFSWEVLYNKGYWNKFTRFAQNSILIIMNIWLFYLANSATSMACMIVALCVFALGRIPSIINNPKKIIYISVTCIVLFGILELFFDFKNTLIAMLGRNSDLTNRTTLWATLLSMVENPFIGTGFMSFWSGHRLEIIFEKIGSEGVQAHNGYLEQYLNLGYVGVVFIGIILVTGILKIRKQLNLDYPIAILRYCFIVIAILFNYTEASFYGINNIWLLTLLGIVEIRGDMNECPEANVN